MSQMLYPQKNKRIITKIIRKINAIWGHWIRETLWHASMHTYVNYAQTLTSLFFFFFFFSYKKFLMVRGFILLTILQAHCQVSIFQIWHFSLHVKYVTALCFLRVNTPILSITFSFIFEFNRLNYVYLEHIRFNSLANFSLFCLTK